MGDIINPLPRNWHTHSALIKRFNSDLANDLGAERVHAICAEYAAGTSGFEIPPSIAARKLPEFYRNITSERDGDLAVVSIFRPEVLNALNGPTLAELDAELARLDADPSVKGVVLTSYQRLSQHL